MSSGTDFLTMLSTDTGSHAHAMDAFYRKHLVLEPEMALMMAVLVDALDTLDKHRGGKDGAFNEAWQWLNDADGDWIFSFVYICETLGLCPDRVRREVVRRVEAGGKRWKYALPNLRNMSREKTGMAVTG